MKGRYVAKGEKDEREREGRGGKGRKREVCGIREGRVEENSIRKELRG